MIIFQNIRILNPQMEQQDEKYMREALREASAALAAGEVPIGAVIVSRGRIIGRGHNMTERLTDTTAHAEMVSITAATEAIGGKYLTDCTLYVTVEPCPMCAGALNWAQIGRIVYGAIDPRRGFSLFTPSLLHPRTEVTAGVLADECTALMQDFFRSGFLLSLQLMARKPKIPGVDPAYLEKQKEALLRKNRYVLYFNDSEMAAVNEYCTRFKVHAKAALFREAIMSKILSELEENHPTLF